MKTNPDVSVVIPTFNRAGLVVQAIDSCLAQCGVSIQVIVVDDCSEDGTREVLSAYGPGIESIYLLANQGQCVARNVGQARASGRYVKFLDSDDVLAQNSLYQEVAHADENRSDVVCAGWGTIELGKGDVPDRASARIFPAPEMSPLPDSVLSGRAVPTSAALYRRAYISGLEWDPAVSKLDDWDYFCRAILRFGRITSLNHVSYWWRQHRHARVTSLASLVENAYSHHQVLRKIEDILREKGILTLERSARLAQYYYKELRVLCLHDRAAFESAVAHIRELDSGFIPVDEERQWYMRIAGRAIGIRRAILIHSFVKRLCRSGY